MPEYLDFVLTRSSGKTKRWEVQTRSRGIVLGKVSWYGAWMQYCYFPNIQQVLSSGCLEDIATHCREQTADWRSAHRGQKSEVQTP